VVPACEHLDDALKKATTVINKPKADAARSLMNEFSGAERSRRFLWGGATLPAGPAMRYCPYCK